MKNRTITQESFLQGDVKTRLGRLANNLERIQLLCHHALDREVSEQLLEESKFFIEWTATEVDIDTAAELVAIQIQLARWQRNWKDVWENSILRMQISSQASQWSERVMELSGLQPHNAIAS